VKVLEVSLCRCCTEPSLHFHTMSRQSCISIYWVVFSFIVSIAFHEMVFFPSYLLCRPVHWSQSENIPFILNASIMLLFFSTTRLASLSVKFFVLFSKRISL
jgi:hypothetical protein